MLMIALVLHVAKPVCQADPTHGSIELRGLHAYPDRESVPAGDVIRFHVSS
ncbi:uncharacterized protein METZ01_LOCUS114824, partial [marine metagenome]